MNDPANTQPPNPPSNPPGPEWQPPRWQQAGTGSPPPAGSPPPPGSPPSSTITCPNCRRPVTNPGAFCPYCGAAFGGVPTSGSSIWRALAILCLLLVALAAGSVGACFVLLGGIAAGSGTIEPTLTGVVVVSLGITIAAVVGIIMLVKRR